MAYASLLLLLAAALPLAAQPGGFVTKELPVPPASGDAIVREDFERCEPAGAVLVDERRTDP